MYLTRWLLIWLATPLTAEAGLAVRAEVEVGDGSNVRFDRVFGPDDGEAVSSGTAFFDGEGNRCDILLNAEPEGPETLLAVKVRCLDGRGREVRRIEPNLLVKNGKVGIHLVGDPRDHVMVRVVVTEDGATADPLVVRRDFFAEPGRRTYEFRAVKRPGESLVCEDGPVSVQTREGWISGQVEGRYRKGEVVRVACTRETSEGAVRVPLVVSFF
jgi:hypothetical protein